jgi:hypothetical protein
MIGSLLSRMGMAEKLSVAQLQKAVQDGTLPAYVGVPLLQDKMQKEQAARAAASGMQQQGQPPIAEQVMQAAQAQQGIDAAPSNLPEQGFAGGGIVAFASGDLVDDETDDSLEERRQISRRRALTADAAARMQQGIETADVSNAGVGISAALPQAGYKGEGIKQADVNLLSYPLHQITDTASIRKDLEYYETRIPNEGTPAMTQAIFSLLYSRLGNAEKAGTWFKDAYVPNLNPPFRVIAETKGGTNPYFATGAGGVLQAVLMGFGGLEITPNGIIQKKSTLPKGWKSVTVSLSKEKHIFVTRK